MRTIRPAVAGCLSLLVGCAEPSVPSPSAERSAPSISPSPTDAQPTDRTTAPADQLQVDLGETAWWASESLGFGTIPEASPDPDPPVQPDGFRQLTVGTLDGSITAVLALHSDWAHSYVAGPYGTDVLVANDTGAGSEVFTISAVDGSRTELFSTPELVAAAALGDDGASIYYVPIDRADGTDDGLWRRPRAGGRPEQVLPGPLGDASPEPRMYWITADPLNGSVVVQWCFGEQRCTSYAVELATGRTLEATEIGWPLGAVGSTFIGDGLQASTGAYLWDLQTGEAEFVPGAAESVPLRIGSGWWFVRDRTDAHEGPTMVLDDSGSLDRLAGDDPPGSTIAVLGERRGVLLPAEWVLRWPAMPIHPVGGTMGPRGIGQLIHVPTARRITLEPFEIAAGDMSCDVPAPTALPSRRRPGFGVLEVVDGIRSVRWGAGDDTVTVMIGVAALGEPQTIGDGVPVSVRGSEGRAVLVGDEGVGQTAFTWVSDGCSYTAWLPPGTSLDATVEYAAGY